MAQNGLQQVKIDAATRVFGVIGHPVVHSKSPLMHNQAFVETGFPGVYAAFDVTDAAGAAAGIRALGIYGASVTIPHKISIMAHLDEVHENARRIGAVNTIVNRDGRLYGHNTDGYGAVSALAEQTDLAKKAVLIVGAGGAARAVGYGLCERGETSVLFANRTEQNARSLAQEFDAGFVPIEKLDQAEFDILVNTTPVGMHPESDAMPVPETVLRPGLVVMDIVYNPLETKLLRQAKARGCRVIDGVGMFVYQGARQFSLWTGMAPPVAQMRRAVYDGLNNP